MRDLKDRTNIRYLKMRSRGVREGVWRDNTLAIRKNNNGSWWFGKEYIQKLERKLCRMAEASAIKIEASEEGFSTEHVQKGYIKSCTQPWDLDPMVMCNNKIKLI